MCEGYSSQFVCLSTSDFEDGGVWNGHQCELGDVKCGTSFFLNGPILEKKQTK